MASNGDPTSESGPMQQTGEAAMEPPTKPVVRVLQMFLPHPWSYTAWVVAVIINGTPMAVVPDIQATIMYPAGPCPLTLVQLKAKLARSKAPQLVICDKEQPEVLEELKRVGVVANRTARVKVAAFSAITEALQAFDPHMVQSIMQIYGQVAASTPAGNSLEPVTASRDPTPAPPAPPVPQEQLPPPSAAPLHPQAAPAAPQAAAAAATPVPQAPQAAAADTAPVQLWAAPRFASPRRAPVPLPPQPSFMPPQPPTGNSFSSLVSKVLATKQAKRQPPAYDDYCDDAAGSATFPLTLPNEPYRPSDLREPYGLQAIVPGYAENATIPLNAELPQVKLYCQVPFHAGRGAEYRGPVKDITFEGMWESLLGYVGYEVKFKRIPISRVSTALVENPADVASYASFLEARGVVNTTMTKHISAIRKVLAWRMSLGGPPSRMRHLQQVMQWMDSLAAQSSNLGLASTATTQRSKLPTAKEMLQLQLKVSAYAEQLMAQDIAKHSKPHRMETLKALQERAMTALMFGYLPPMRLACLRTLLHPSTPENARGLCQEPGCRKGEACPGNRLTWLDEEHTRLSVMLSHHKCESRWDYLPITFELPTELTEELLPHIMHSHKELAAEGQPLMFVQTRTGLGMSNVNLSQWWQALLAKHNFHKRISPHQLRSVFVDERLGAERVEGPSNEAAAIIMGNSVERWILTYDKNRRVRHAQEAGDTTKMSLWRKQLLALLD